MILSGKVISQTSPNNLPDYPTGLESEPPESPRVITNPGRNQSQEEFERFRRDMQRNMSAGNNMNGMNPEERIRQMQQMAQEQEEQAMMQVLRINERQWKALKPKIDKVKKYKEQAEVGIGMPFNSSFSSTSSPSGGQSFSGGFNVSFGGGGFASSSVTPNVNQTNQRLTKGQRICQELQMLLDSASFSGQNQESQKAIQTKMKELQQVRAEAKKQLAKAQEELKNGLDLNLQARLMLLGLLD